MPETVIDVFGLQLEGIVASAVVFGFGGLIFLVAFMWGFFHVESRLGGNDNRGDGCDFTRGLDEDLRGVGNGSKTT